MLELGPTTFLQILNFVVLLVVLRALLWKPLMKTLADRKHHIETRIREAEAIHEEAEHLKEDYEKRIAQAKAEAGEILKKMIAEAEKMKEQQIREGKAEVARIRKQAEQDVTAAREKALREVKNHVVELAITTASKILRDSLNHSSQERLMSEFIRKVGEKYVN